MQALSEALRAGVPDVLSRLDALEADVAAGGGGGGGSVTFGSPVALAAGGTNADGVSTDSARADHVHATPRSAPVALTAGGTVVTGASGNFADASHVHATARSAPAALVVGGSAVTGVSNDFADAAHVHALPAFGTGAGTFAEGNDARLSDDRTASGLRTASTVVSVSSATAPTSGQVLTATGGSAATWQTPSGGGSTVSIWEPRAQPASAHADDNEFLSSIADFTTWDHGAYQTRTLVTADKCLEINSTGNSTVRFGGMYKAVPGGGEYSLVVNCGYSTPAVSNLSTGIVLLQGTGATDDIRTLRTGNLTATSGPFVLSDTYTQYNGAQSAVTQHSTAHASWLRFRVNGTTCASDWSPDGVTWIFLVSVTLGFTPSHMGVLSAPFVAVSSTSRFYCFRVKSGAGASAFDANRPGRVVTVGV